MPEAPRFLTAAGGRLMLGGSGCSERCTMVLRPHGSNKVCLFATTGPCKRESGLTSQLVMLWAAAARPPGPPSSPGSPAHQT